MRDTAPNRASVYRHTSKFNDTPRWPQKNDTNSEYILVVRRDQIVQSRGPGTYPRASRKAPPATFADETYARSRSRCSRPKRGQPKVPFSWCICPILVIGYRWGSMGSDETASTVPGGPRVIAVFDANEAPSGPNYLLFSGADRFLDVSRGRSGSG